MRLTPLPFEADAPILADGYFSRPVDKSTLNIAHRATSFLGIDFADVSADDVLRFCAQNSKASGFVYITTPNVDHVVTLHSEQPITKSFRAAENAAAVRLCDSRILAGLARISGVRLTAFPGSDLTARLLTEVVRPGHRVAIVGGNEAQLLALREQLPEIDFFQHIPPMGVIADKAAQDAICRFVEQADADFVFLTIGAPQSEVVARAIARSGKARGLGLCVGASLAFFTGQLQRAPRVLQRLHLEWLFRCLSEPRRLWRRYLVRGPRIFLIWWQYQFARRGPAFTLAEAGPRGGAS